MDSFEYFFETIGRSSFKGYGKLEDPGFANSLADKYYENPNKTDLYNYLRKVLMQIRGLMTTTINSIPEDFWDVALRHQSGMWPEQVKMADKTVSMLAKLIKENDPMNFNASLYRTAGFISSIKELANLTIKELARQDQQEWPEFKIAIEKLEKLKSYINDSKVMQFLYSVPED